MRDLQTLPRADLIARVICVVIGAIAAVCVWLALGSAAPSPLLVVLLAIGAALMLCAGTVGPPRWRQAPIEAYLWFGPR